MGSDCGGRVPPVAVIVKFVTCRERRAIFDKGKHAKGDRYTREDLTVRRLAMDGSVSWLDGQRTIYCKTGFTLTFIFIIPF